MKTKFYSLAVILLSLFNIHANAQTPHVDFTYDATGNRTLRQYFAARIMNDTAKVDPEAQEIAQQYGISVYPNPLMDGKSATVTILTKAEASAGAKAIELPVIDVLDNTGKVLFSQQPSASSSEIDLSKYSAGVYYIKVTVEKEQLFYKVLKAK